VDEGCRGGTVAFNLRAADGTVVPYQDVEARANAARVQIRGGCFCNPGAAEAAFARDAEQMAAAGAGALRASVGVATTRDDIHRLIAVLASFDTRAVIGP
jgi:selenocysteine lyase/cysteine desulfurase